LAALVFNVGGNNLTIPRYSYLATSVTTLLTEVVVVGVGGWYLVWRATDFRPQLAFAWKAAVAAAMMGCIVWPLQALPFGVALLVGIPLGAIVYVGLLFVLGGLSWSTVREALARPSEIVA
jgi:O-antigen/teichoic acid export membrane protein